MTGYLEDHGATILCGRRVTRLLLEDGRCIGVETDDGEQYLASTAVVSTIHVKHLRDMAPAQAWPPGTGDRPSSGTRVHPPPPPMSCAGAQAAAWAGYPAPVTAGPGAWLITLR